jgi:hypothetical protein
MSEHARQVHMEMVSFSAVFSGVGLLGILSRPVRPTRSPRACQSCCPSSLQVLCLASSSRSVLDRGEALASQSVR